MQDMYGDVETFESGDDRARTERFTACYVREYPRVSAFLYRRTGDRSAAEELAAEVFRIAWERELAGEETGSGWLFVTARNLLGNHYRATLRLRELHRRITGELDRPAATDVDSHVLDALDALPERHRQVLLLTYWDGLSATEAGEVLGCRGSAVWVRLHRARKAFRDLYVSPLPSPTPQELS